ncbi:hypothetical protein [Nocardioides sp.]|uniref:hypothetical protein n=1 Tax=Nocardioides sp. TaxID=35761 RepID=UPI0037837AF1
MSEFDLTEDVEPEERPDEEEFEAADGEAVSPETGTHYDLHGEPEATPQDLEPVDTEGEE